MSGWDATSRPTWDPQGGTGENTQAFGVPEFADEGGFPSSATPGTPPAIFLQDYDQNDFGQHDFAQGDFAQGDFAQGDFAQGDFGQGRQGDFGPQDRGARPYNGDEDPGRRGYGQRGSASGDYPRPDLTPRDQRDDFQWQSPDRDYATRDFPDTDYGDRLDRGGYADFADRNGDAEPEFAARMDPALRDFFVPEPDRQDPLQQGYGQPRHDPRGYPGQGTGQGRGGQFGPGTSNGHRPGSPGQGGQGGQGAPGGYTGQSGRWDFGPERPERLERPRGPQSPRGPQPPRGPQRPAPRSGHRQDRPAERRGLAPAVVAIAIVVVVGIAIGAYMLTRSKPAAPSSAQGTPPASPTASATQSPTKTELKSGAGAGYTMKTPATAGGYAKLTSVPSAVQTAAGTASAAIKSAAVTTGAKVTATVTAGYQLSSGQVLAFTGYEGTFNPAKVMSALAALGTDSHSQPAGSHGGMLACAITPSSAGTQGTVCVWVTPTTMGVAEFFAANNVPEKVTVQSKAASDTVGMRGDVEVSKR